MGFCTLFNQRQYPKIWKSYKSWFRQFCNVENILKTHFLLINHCYLLILVSELRVK